MIVSCVRDDFWDPIHHLVNLADSSWGLTLRSEKWCNCTWFRVTKSTWWLQNTTWTWWTVSSWCKVGEQYQNIINQFHFPLAPKGPQEEVSVWLEDHDSKCEMCFKSCTTYALHVLTWTHEISSYRTPNVQPSSEQSRAYLHTPQESNIYTLRQGHWIVQSRGLVH